MLAASRDRATDASGALDVTRARVFLTSMAITTLSRRGGHQWSLPNLLTYGRVVAVPVVVACLYWSGSKAAWLFMVIVGVLAIGHSSFKMAWKRTLIYGLIAFGLVGFAIKYADSVGMGKKSMEARLIYWQAAVRITGQHPITGTGPGTFGPAYKRIQPANAEYAALAHNDYLEQASDSGILGLLTFSGLIIGSLMFVYRYRLIKNCDFSEIRFAVWLGLVGIFLHSGMEFNLYYPALAWPAFFLLGWLLGLPEE